MSETGIEHASGDDGTIYGGPLHKTAHTYEPSAQGQNAPLKFVPLDASASALSQDDQTESTGVFTDLDLSAHISANAKAVSLQLRIKVEAPGGSAYYLAVRKNGTTPSHYPRLQINSGEAHTNDEVFEHVIVACDAGQIIEYFRYVGGGTADFHIEVLGYWE